MCDTSTIKRPNRSQIREIREICEIRVRKFIKR